MYVLVTAAAHMLSDMKDCQVCVGPCARKRFTAGPG